MSFAFSPAERDCLAAVLDCLIPPGGPGPGAVEAGVPDFIARQLDGAYGTTARWFEPADEAREGGISALAPAALYRVGLIGLDALARDKGADSFAQLSPANRVQLLSELERGQHDTATAPMRRFFEQVLENCIEGYFSDPIHGGNRDARAWTMIGFPGCGHDYSQAIRTHRNRKLAIGVRTIQSLRQEIDDASAA